MGSVGSPPHLGSSIDLYVLNHQRVYIQSFKLSIALSIFEELKQDLCTLLWPPALGSWRLQVLGLSFTSHATIESSEGMICFLAITSLRYLFALRMCMPLMATAVSCVFLKCTRRLEPRALQDLVGFS